MVSMLAGKKRKLKWNLLWDAMMPVYQTQREGEETLHGPELQRKECFPGPPAPPPKRGNTKGQSVKRGGVRALGLL